MYVRTIWSSFESSWIFGWMECARVLHVHFYFQFLAHFFFRLYCPFLRQVTCKNSVTCDEAFFFGEKSTPDLRLATTLTCQSYSYSIKCTSREILMLTWLRFAQAQFLFLVAQKCYKPCVFVSLDEWSANVRPWKVLIGCPKITDLRLNCACQADKQ